MSNDIICKQRRVEMSRVRSLGERCICFLWCYSNIKINSIAHNMLSDKLSDVCVAQLINTGFFQNPNMQRLSEVFNNPFNTLVSLYLCLFWTVYSNGASSRWAEHVYLTKYWVYSEPLTRTLHRLDVPSPCIRQNIEDMGQAHRLDINLRRPVVWPAH